MPSAARGSTYGATVPVARPIPIGSWLLYLFWFSVLVSNPSQLRYSPLCLVSKGAPVKVPVLYCATIVLGGYSSLSGKIHYIQDVTSLYICGTTFCKLWQFTPWASSLLPSTDFWPILLPSKPSHSWVTSSAHPHQPHLSCLRIKGAA